MQVALAWVLKNPAITAPIIGASRPEQLADSLAAAEQGPLPADLKAKLDEMTHGWRAVDAERKRRASTRSTATCATARGAASRPRAAW